MFTFLCGIISLVLFAGAYVQLFVPPIATDGGLVCLAGGIGMLALTIWPAWEKGIIVGKMKAGDMAGAKRTAFLHDNLIRLLALAILAGLVWFALSLPPQ